MEKYQTLVAWQRAHTLARLALAQTDAAYQSRCRDLFGQLRSAAVSVEANIVEGYALGTTPQFRKHLRTAMGSAADTECLTRLAGELGGETEHGARSTEQGAGSEHRAEKMGANC